MVEMTKLPFRLSRILGQEGAKDLLLRAYRKGAVSHAYIFRGPSGVGKKSTAQSFAAFLNCQKRQNDDACGSCSSCQKFASGNHPDFLFLQPEGSGLKIEQVRGLKKTLTFPPFEAEYRVVVFPDIHESLKRREVANSLLKTLEEPPANTVIILTADEAGEILPTIMSRGQIVRFVPLEIDAVTDLLVDQKHLARNDAVVLAELSGGSLGRSLQLSEQSLLELRSTLVESLLQIDRQADEIGETILDLADRLAELKEELFDFFILIRLWFRDLILFMQLGSNRYATHRDLHDQIEKGASRWTLSELFTKSAALETGKRQLDRNCNRNAVCEVVLWNLFA